MIQVEGVGFVGGSERVVGSVEVKFVSREAWNRCTGSMTASGRRCLRTGEGGNSSSVHNTIGSESSTSGSEVAS